ncbi:MAG TPA: peroxiredoxin [Gemmatimonadaceae bacterium]
MTPAKKPAKPKAPSISKRPPTDLLDKPAPDFTAETDTGESLTLSSLRGKVVVLFFYPKDDTEGCTVEACSFRDELPRFEGLDAVVLGVSRDSARKHRNFKTKYSLPYTLIVDDGAQIAQAYNIIVEKSLYGRKYIAPARTTFIIDRQGRVARIFENVKPPNHAAEVAEAIAEIGH